MSENKRYGCLVAGFFLFVLIAAFVLNNAENKGYSNGYDVGHDDGYEEGYEAGYDDCDYEKAQGYESGYDDGRSDGRSEMYDEIGDEYEFFHDYAVIVTTTGSKYHHYGCYHIEGRRYYIYNIENAEAKGYTPCLDCW